MWGEYVPVHVRRAQAKKKMEKLAKQGQKIEPIELEGKTITRRFWGKQWCEHIEKMADYRNRLPRGKTYVRNGSVCHLAITKGQVDAIVSGSSLYKVSISIKTLAEGKWDSIKKRCTGLIGSLLELLQGKISDNVMHSVADDKEGLFPGTKDMSFECDCPDWAGMCKHVAAVFYGIGSRLDERPELLFLLRGVDPQELVSMEASLAVGDTGSLSDSAELSALFDIDLDQQESVPAPLSPKTIAKRPTKQPAIDCNTLTGRELRKFRLHLKMTVQEFADVLQVTAASIYRWENTEGLLRLQSRTKNALLQLSKK